MIKNLKELRAAYRLSRSPNFKFLSFPPGHFYSPIPDTSEIDANEAAIFDQSATELPGIDLQVDSQIALLQQFGAFYADMPFREAQHADARYYFDNPFFSYGDALALYSIMRVGRPRRIVEVGSGFSSAAMLDIDERFFQNSIDFTFVEPYPERLSGLLRPADRQRCRVIDARVQDVESDVFAALEPSDILFVDSSHVAKIASDTLHLLFTVLPMLKPGVLVHIHDILWPFEYPKVWLEQGRAWNEAYLVRAFLMYNRTFEVVFFNSFMAVRHRDLLNRYLPLASQSPSSAVTKGNSSLWLRKVS